MTERVRSGADAAGIFQVAGEVVVQLVSLRVPPSSVWLCLSPSVSGTTVSFAQPVVLSFSVRIPSSRDSQDCVKGVGEKSTISPYSKTHKNSI